MISEGSCDIEDWSNGFWNFSFAITEINYMLKYINIEICYFKRTIFHNITVSTVFSYQINAALVSIRDFSIHSY